ncbi:asparaginase [Paenibacillus sp. UNCCL117]|uniref:asparaginase n=1 Tax=unclassified Paenibacillus TaxID=185978 RepID=UPI0008827E33|nr:MULTISPECIES: asparaginase [unclassified Paenibacillus]SDD98972.1 L-asparaginase II [Paenibacillus sp. cl123]SFW55831.1 asparaginase [Paenibacillus sp. UNCCL117]
MSTHLSAPFVAVTRGSLTESVHRGHLAAVDASGRLIAGAGDSRFYTYARSTAKPLQAIPLLEMGGAERYALTEPEIALICASHNGEPAHTQTALSILGKAGLDVSALDCGPQEPLLKREADKLKYDHMPATAIHNNCSGKHAGMLALARLMQASTHQYTRPEHPVQQKMLHAISEMCEVPVSDIQLGIDGCGVPVFAMELSALALGYAKLGRPDSLAPARAQACRLIVQAIGRSPFYLAGTDRFDTRLAEVTGGRIIGKMGAEGVFAAAIPAEGAGIALKLEDGAERALYPAAAEALLQLGFLTEEEAEKLRPYHRPDVVNRRGEIVGKLEPVIRLAR